MNVRVFLVLGFLGLVWFFMGVASLFGNAPWPAFGYPVAILGLLLLVYVLVELSQQFQAKHSVLFALGELAIGIIVCVVNIRAVHRLTPIAFYSVLSAGVLACVEGMKDLIK